MKLEGFFYYLIYSISFPLISPTKWRVFLLSYKRAKTINQHISTSTKFKRVYAKKKGNYNVEVTKPTIIWLSASSLSTSSLSILLSSFPLLPNFLNSHQKTFPRICTSSFRTEVLCISRVVIKQLRRYQLQDYFQINAFLIDGCGMRKSLLCTGNATDKELYQAVKI